MNRRHRRRSTGARSGARGIALLLEQGFEQAPQLAVTRRLASLAQVVGNIQLSCAALSNAGAAHIDVCPSMLDVEALAVGVENKQGSLPIGLFSSLRQHAPRLTLS